MSHRLTRPAFTLLAWSPRQWLLGALFGVSGLLAWWLLRQFSDVLVPPVERVRQPDYVVLNFVAVETDATGQPERRLMATELRHFVTENRSELDQPHLELFQSDGSPWEGRAREGLVFADGDQIRLIGDVQLDRAAQGARRATHLETQQIEIWRQQSLAETDLPVLIRSDDDVLTATGMQLWYAEPSRTIFHGRARIRFAPDIPSRTPAQEIKPSITPP